MELTDFLLARIAEDEAEARVRGAEAMNEGSSELRSAARANSQLRVAECAAKRQVVELHKSWPTTDPPTTLMLLTLAATYSDHPDYQESWSDAPASTPEMTKPPALRSGGRATGSW